MARGNPLIAVRLPRRMVGELHAAAGRRDMSVSDYLRPMLQYLATIDQEDVVWGNLGYMRLPKVEKVPISHN